MLLSREGAPFDKLRVLSLLALSLPNESKRPSM
jgi:hypothetical protein